MFPLFLALQPPLLQLSSINTIAAIEESKEKGLKSETSPLPLNSIPSSHISSVYLYYQCQPCWPLRNIPLLQEILMIFLNVVVEDNIDGFVKTYYNKCEEKC